MKYSTDINPTDSGPTHSGNTIKPSDTEQPSDKKKKEGRK